MHMSNARLAVDEGLLLWTLEEISRLVSQNGNPSETLGNVVHLIQRRFATDVCSVYLLEQDRASLMLAATVGLRPESVGRVRMRLTEGLAGLVAEELQPQVVADATRHPRFKYFRETGEDPYRSFLGVPIIDRGLLQGVLIVQTTEQRAFSQDDVRMLVTAGAQVGPDRQSGARARADSRRRRASGCTSWLATCGGAGTTKQPASSASWIRPDGRPAGTIRWRCSSAFPPTRWKSGRSRSPSTVGSTTPIAGCRSISTPTTPGARGMPASCGRGRSRISRRSSACTSRFRSIRVVLASSPAIT